jgi:hypothetical protein
VAAGKQAFISRWHRSVPAVKLLYQTLVPANRGDEGRNAIDVPLLK